MPIYEYQCQECEHELEALQRISESPLSDCPACGQPALRKLISAPRFRLKGSGWYETDFKTGDKKNLAGEKEAKKPDTRESKDGDKPKSESKPGKTDSTKSAKSGSGDGSKGS
ncbi:MAG: zinc ribbon domain-containing protein [Gammaproteobacteria bacterium]|nr:zinc ribbon domain-containing protein [Gammaproteobacteria bacterium]